MKRLLPLILVPVVGCYGGERATTGQCPAGETCSTLTPYGLQFVGSALADDLLVSGPAATAIGGTQDVALQYDRGDGVLVALDIPYTADDDGGIGVAVDHTTGSVVTVKGVGSRTNYLRILDAADGTLFDRKELTGASIDSIALTATDFEQIPPGMSLAWATGEQKLGIALAGQVQEATGPVDERLVDGSMQVALAGADRVAWDELHLAQATVGSYAVAITAGDRPATTLQLDVVDHADAVAAIAPPDAVETNLGADVCFAATNAGRFVVGLAWTFTVDGAAVAASEPNCVPVDTTKTTGSIAIRATAGGQSQTLTLPIGASARHLPTGGPRSTAGDRAAMMAKSPAD